MLDYIFYWVRQGITECIVESSSFLSDLHCVPLHFCPAPSEEPDQTRRDDILTSLQLHLDSADKDYSLFSMKDANRS